MKTFVLMALMVSSCGGGDDKRDASADGSTADAGTPTWYMTCGSPVCGSHIDAGIASCTTQVAGSECAVPGQKCDPDNDCNSYLECATADPRLSGGGGCPISRERFKQDIHFLSAAELDQNYRELLELPLARYRYRANPKRERLGFILDGHESLPAADAENDQVDLYAYTSMAVAALKVQAEEIEALHRQVESLERRINRQMSR
jgi:hypothetical protein